MSGENPAPVMVNVEEGATPTVTYYGADWCPDCRRSKSLLDKNKVAYALYDTDIHGRPEQGMKKIPTIVWPDGSFLQEPSDSELSKKLGLE